VHLPRTLEQLCLDTTSLQNVPSLPNTSNPANHLPLISAPHPPTHQSWQTNQKALPYGIGPKEHSATGALPFSNISQRQLKVSLMCGRWTELGAPWRSLTTFQIPCMTFPFSVAPRILGLTSNSSSHRFPIAHSLIHRV
jgi:hypothetical protein